MDLSGVELIFLNKDLEKAWMINDQNSLYWMEKYHDIGEFSINVNNSSIPNSIRDKLVYVKVPFSGYIGRIDEPAVDDFYTVLSGSFAEELLSFRPDVSRKTYTGKAEDVMFDIVNTSIINGDDPMPFIELGTSKGRGKDTVANIFGKDVYSALKQIAEVNNFSIRLTLDTKRKKFTFNVFEGLNRTRDQTENSVVVFSRESQNVNNDKYKVTTNYHNKALVYGMGEDANRRFVSVLSPDYMVGEEIRSKFVDARDLQLQEGMTLQQYDEGLKLRGLDYLAKEGKKESLDANITITNDMDFGLGDVVIYRHTTTDKIFHTQITELHHVFERAYEKKVILGKPKLGLMGTLENKGAF